MCGASVLPGREVENMAVVSFLNTFLSYLLLMVIILALGGVAIFAGITLRKKKNAREAEQESAQTE